MLSTRQKLNRLAIRINGLMQRTLRHQELRLATTGGSSGSNRALMGCAHWSCFRIGKNAFIEEWSSTLNQFHGRLLGLNSSLSHLDPEHVLSRGYAIVRNKKGAILRSTKLIEIDERPDCPFA